MLTKEGLVEIIKRRHGADETLSIERIDGEQYSNWQIREAAKKHFGGWAKARNEVVGVSKHGHKPLMSRKEVIDKLRSLQSEGHSMKSADFEPWFYRRIKDVLGGYMQAKALLGIAPVRKEGNGALRRELSDVVAELREGSGSIKNKGDFNKRFRHIGAYSRRHYGDAYEIFRIAGLPEPPTAARRKVARYWTDVRIESEIRRAIRESGSTSGSVLKRNGHGRLVGAVKSRHGTWNAGLVAYGYEVAHKRRSNVGCLTKESMKEAVMSALAKGVAPNTSELRKEIPGFSRALYREFDSMGALKEYCGFCAIKDSPDKDTYINKRPQKYRPELTTPEGIRREITRMWYIGAPLNYTYMRSTRRHIVDAVNKYIGSWSKAVESIGLNYNDVSVTSNKLSECGTAFENLFARILTELGYEYTREGENIEEILPGFNLKPDFILPNWRWVDCKLSEWTGTREMLKRYYSENPNGITVVYLRGKNHRISRGRKWKYEHVSVYQFTKELPTAKREYYEARLREIEAEADSNANAG